MALQAVAATAGRLCRADYARVFLRDGGYLVAGPSARPTGAGDGWEVGDRSGPITEQRFASAVAARTGQTVHAEDYLVYLRV